MAGSYFARPGPIEALEEMLIRQSVRAASLEAERTPSELGAGRVLVST